MSAQAISRDLEHVSQRDVAVRWLREHLFASRFDALVTLAMLGAVAFVLYHALGWVLFHADWSVIHANARLLLVGRFPVGEEWRIWAPTLLALALGGATWGLLRGVSRTMLAGSACAWGALLWVAGEHALAAVGGAAAVWFVALAAGRLAAAHRVSRRWMVRAVVAGWLTVWPLAIALLVLIGGGVEVERWGGLYLNVIVTAAGAMGALPIGILLALGRRSPYRVIRTACSTSIEIARGLPLMVVLILSWLAIQRFLPSVWGINQVGLVPRILAAYILFTAVYVGVCVTGGLNGLPKGQSEAAAALGLTSAQSMRFVLLPQAMRRALPALIGELIDLLMASTLVSVLGLTDILAAARATTEQPAFFGRQKEVLLFVGAVFWVTAFSLSRLGRVAERALTPRESGGTVQR